MALTKAQLIDLNANELIIDLDADTSITADTDDQIDIKIAGADDFRFTANTFTALAGSSIVVPASGLTIGSTAVTSTAAELNLLDGVSGLVQADLTKLAALDATAAEINFIDGGATIGTTAVADADGIIHNDGGTMKVTTAATFKTYFQEGISQAYDDFTIGDAAVLITTSSGNITVDAAANDSDIILKGTDGGVDTTFLTIDGSAAGSATFNHDVILPNNGILQLGDAGENISGDGTNLTITSSADVIVKLGGDQLILHDGTSNIGQFDLTSNHLSIDVLGNEKDMFFKGFDGGSQITALTLDMSAAGAATFNDKITAVGTSVFTNLDISGDVDIDGTLEADAITINGTAIASVLSPVAGGSSIVTTGALDSGSITSGFGAIDNGTSNIRSATITAETAFVPDAANGATLGTASLEFADMYLHDGGIVYFGADQDVELAHVADVGLTLKTATTSDDTQATLTLQTGDTDIATNDVIGQLHFQAPDEGAGTDAILVAAGIAAISEGNFSASNNATSLVFKTGASEAATEKMRILSDGKVGIGDTSPSGILEVSDTDNETYLVVQNAKSGGSGEGVLSLKNDVGNWQVKVFTDDTFRIRDNANAADRVVVHSNGVASFNNGIALGVGTANTASNVLDDYEEGTFTPVFAYGTSGSGYQAQNGRYTKIGNQCIFQLQIQGNGLSTTTDQIRISGLPFTSLNAAPYGGGAVGISSNFKSDGDITVHKGAGDDDLYFYEYSGSALLGSEATNINAGLLIHGQYITD